VASEPWSARFRWRGATTLLATLTLLAGPARADELAQAEAPSVPAAPAPTDQQLERARLIVATAERLFVAGHYGAALAEYTRAYDTLAGHPRQYWVLHNLAACNEHLFRYDVALSLYEEYLRRAPADEPDRADVSAITRTLRALLVTLDVESRVRGEVWVDDRRIGLAPGRWLVPAGRHIVELRAPLFESEKKELTLSGNGVTRVSFDPRPLSTYRGPDRAYFWGAVGASGVAAATGLTFGLMAVGARGDARQKAELYQDTDDDSRRTRNLALAADVGFGAALVFGITASVLYFVTDWSPRPQQGRGSSSPVRIGRSGARAPGVVMEF
jgi:tetratricopeptide (TPR) repeat protein